MWLTSIVLALFTCVPTFLRVCPNMPTTRYYLSNQTYLSPDPEANPFINRLTSNVPADTDDGGLTIYYGPTGMSPHGFEGFDSGYGPFNYTSGPWELMNGNSLGNALGWVSTLQPPSAPTTYPYIFGGWRTRALSGRFAPGTWTVNVRLHNVYHNWNGAFVQGLIYGRLFKANVDGSNAREVANRIRASQVFTITDAGVVDTSITFNVNDAYPQGVDFAHEYLFIQIALRVQSWGLTFTGGTGDPSLTYAVVIDYGAATFLNAPNFVPVVRSEDICEPFGQSEMYIYISPDGVQYPLDVDGRRVVLNDQGTGTPPLQYITQRGPFQHGETLLAAYAQPRVVQLMILHKYSNRDSWWNGRANLLQQLSPRKQAVDGANDVGVLRRILSTGEKRDLNCLIQEGPKFNPRGDNVWDELSYTEALRFIGFDPIYYDPRVHNYVFDTQGSELTFPFIFPFTLTTILQHVSLQYEGTWLAYPKFIINGPMTFVHIENVTTGELIEIIYDLAEGETITIDLQYGTKTVVLGDGTNLLPYVRHTSNLGTFHLTETMEGINEFHVHMVGVTVDSQIEMQYNPRYVGI